MEIVIVIVSRDPLFRPVIHPPIHLPPSHFPLPHPTLRPLNHMKNHAIRPLDG